MTEIIGVRFRGGPKEYYFDPRGAAVAPGQFVVVETASGQEYARCVTGNREVEDSELTQPLRPLLRVATEDDARTWELNCAREKAAFGICREKIALRGLDMKLVKVEGNFDMSKIVFYFTSEGRVDFRALVRDLASELHTRIELRQIGVRDEAKFLGGIGVCGRGFCCAEFLDDFLPVSIKMAKTQNLSLNPTKISGTCGRLMCCLKYEQDAYEDAVRRCPKQDSFVMTPDGPGNIVNVDILREQAVVRLDDQPESPKRYHNCELNVLRNGKGSREGIEIPRERPSRLCAPEEPENSEIAPSDGGDKPSDDTNGKRRVHRGARRKSDKPAVETAAGTEKPAMPVKSEKPAVPVKPMKPSIPGKQGKTAVPAKPGKPTVPLKSVKPAVSEKPGRAGKGPRQTKREGRPEPEKPDTAQDGTKGNQVRRRYRGGGNRYRKGGTSGTEA